MTQTAQEKAMMIAVKLLEKEQKIKDSTRDIHKLRKKNTRQELHDIGKQLSHHSKIENALDKKAHDNTLTSLGITSQNHVSPKVREKFDFFNPSEQSYISDSDYNSNRKLFDQQSSKELLKELHSKDGNITMHDLATNTDADISTDLIDVVPIGKNRLAFKSEAVGGNHNNYKIIGNFAPDGTPLAKHHKIIHGDGYEHEHMPTTEDKLTRKEIIKKMSDAQRKIEMNPTGFFTPKERESYNANLRKRKQRQKRNS